MERGLRADVLGSLQGARVLVTRARDQGEELAQAIVAAGGVPCRVPCIRIAPLADPGPLESSLRGLEATDWLVLTSARAVQVLVALPTWRPALRARVAVVGGATRRAAEEAGLRVHLVPGEARAAALAAALLERLDPGVGRVLFPRAQGGREELVDVLRARGVEVEVIDAYQTTACPERSTALRLALAEGPLDLLTLASPSAVRALREALDEVDAAELLEVPAVCVGPVTAQEARERGFRCVVEARTAAVLGLIEACLRARR